MTEKKRQRRKDARPDEIISAALKEFAEKGYAGTSIGSVAKRADIARSTVYIYFDDKEALIRQAFEDRIGSVFANLEPNAIPNDLPFETVFHGMLEVFYARMTSPENLVLFKVLVSEGNVFPELTAFYHSTILKKGEGFLSHFISQAIEKGEVRPEIIHYDPKIIIAPLIAAAMWQLTFQKLEPLDLPKYIQGHVDILMRGILIGSK